MKCNSCGSEWNVSKELTITVEECPFCHASLQPASDSTCASLPTLDANRTQEAGVSNGSFPQYHMPIMDVFYIKGRGTIVTGQLMLGSINVGNPVDVYYADGRIKHSTIIGIDMFRRTLDSASQGDHIGVLLQNVSPDEAAKAIGIISPNTKIIHSKFIGYIGSDPSRLDTTLNNTNLGIMIQYAGRRGYLIEGSGYVSIIENDYKHPDMDKVMVDLSDNPLVVLPNNDFAIHKDYNIITKGLIDIAFD